MIHSAYGRLRCELPNSNLRRRGLLSKSNKTNKIAERRNAITRSAKSFRETLSFSLFLSLIHSLTHSLTRSLARECVSRRILESDVRPDATGTPSRQREQAQSERLCEKLFLSHPLSVNSVLARAACVISTACWTRFGALSTPGTFARRVRRRADLREGNSAK